MDLLTILRILRVVIRGIGRVLDLSEARESENNGVDPESDA